MNPRAIVAPLAAFVAVLSLPLSPSRAALTPVDFAVRGVQEVHAVLLEEGIFIDDEGEALFSCAEQFTDADSVIWTGRSAHGFVSGAEGAWLTTESGCHWRRTTGAVDGQRIVGHYQREEGSDRVVFAIDDPFGGTAVVETVDGGFTSTLSGDLALDGVRFLGLAGEGAEAAIAVRGADGGFWAAWSDDGGVTFVPNELSEHLLSDAVSFAGFGGARVWVQDAGDLIGVDAEGVLSLVPLEVDCLGSIAVGADGALWCAAGADGLWTSRDGQGWERVQSEHTTRVKRALDKLWIARSVTRAGAPVVLRSDDEGMTWRPVWLAPEAWRYPATCQSSADQVCGESAIALRSSLGLEVAEAHIDGQEVKIPAEQTGCAGVQGHGDSVPLVALLCVLLLATRARVPSSP